MDCQPFQTWKEEQMQVWQYLKRCDVEGSCSTARACGICNIDLITFLFHLSAQKMKVHVFRPLAAMPCLIVVEWETWDAGSKCESTRSSPSLLTHRQSMRDRWKVERHLQKHQQATHTTAKTMMSKEFERSSPWQRDLRCLIVMGSHLGWLDSDGANFEAPAITLLRAWPPHHRASLTCCHSWRPSNQDSIAPLPTDAAPYDAMKRVRRDSDAGKCSDSGTLWSSQNLVKHRRPAE